MILFELCIRKWIILLYKLQFMSFVDVHKTCMFTQRTGMLSHMTDGGVSKNGVRTLISFLAFTWKICYYIITFMPPSEIFKGHLYFRTQVFKTSRVMNLSCEYMLNMMRADSLLLIVSIEMITYCWRLC